MDRKEAFDLLEKFTSKDQQKEQFAFLGTICLFFLLHLLIIATTYWQLNIFFSIAIGLVSTRLFSMYHEFNHGVILSQSILAKIFFFLFGIYTLFPQSAWITSHTIHHKTVGIFSKKMLGYFPLLTVTMFTKLSLKEKIIYRLARSPLCIILSPFFLLINGIKKSIFIVNQFYDLLLSKLIFIFISIGLYLFYDIELLLFLYIIPLFLFISIGTLLLFLQHNFKGVQFFPPNEGKTLECIVNSSNTIIMNPMWRWISCNSGFHMIHHINSNIPFYQLKLAHEYFAKQYPVPETKFTLKNAFAPWKNILFNEYSQKIIDMKTYNKIYK